MTPAPRAGEEGAGGERGPESGGGGGGRDQDREDDERRLVREVPLEADARHAQVVRGGDAEAGEGAARDQRHAGGAPVADDEEADADHHDDHDQADEHMGPVAGERCLHDGEARDGHVVHDPDAEADGERAEQQPDGPGGASRACRTRASRAGLAGASGACRTGRPDGAAEAHGGPQAGHEEGQGQDRRAMGESVDRSPHAGTPFPKARFREGPQGTDSADRY